jgi:hypothetical protein
VGNERDFFEERERPPVPEIKKVRRSVYVSAPCTIIEMAHLVAKTLHEAGFDVTSTWHDVLSGYDKDKSDQELADCAARDIREMSEADIFLQLTEEPSITGGSNVELGLAMATDMDIYVIGPKRNVFHYTDRIVFVGDLNEFLSVSRM